MKTQEPSVRQEMDQDHRERADRLLVEAGCETYTSERLLAAYQAVLLKDVLWAVNELLAHKQYEVHR